MLLFPIILMQACSSGKPGSLSVIEDRIALSGLESISIEIKAGTLGVSSGSGGELHLSGMLADPTSVEINQIDSRIEIVHPKSQVSDTLQIQVPNGSDLTIKAFSADIGIQNFSGDLTLNSSAGDVTIAGFSGSATVWAGRGEITVTNSNADLILITEHGAVNVESFSGEISMSTIMGSLNYTGTQGDQNVVRMEADHGPIYAVFPASADLSISASSTNGEVVCMGAGIQNTVDGCRANIGAGEGAVKIRTVTGRIEFRIVDLQEEN